MKTQGNAPLGRLACCTALIAVIVAIFAVTGCGYSGDSGSFAGSYKIDQVEMLDDGERVDASGTITVTDEKISISVTIGSYSNKLEGVYQGTTDNGVPYYQMSSGGQIAFGKAQGSGAYSAMVTNGSEILLEFFAHKS